MCDFSQLLDELCHCLYVMFPPFQQLIAETGDVLFDLFQFPYEAVGEKASEYVL